MVSDFYDHPDLYDALLPVDAHVPFYVDLARQQGGAVLELACGTGQLTIPVALVGLPAVGLDQSRAMLNVASRRASAAELPLLISAAGFELISRFDDLSRAPFGPASRVQVCLCRPRA